MDIWIDNRYFKVNNNYTIFQYCAKIGINLPCFCYHERLSIAGNCRICLVEANNGLVVSCATLLLDKMNIFTKSKRIKKAREGVLEFLLVNHPLDCPICDQGGECDLQDILMIYGSDRGRFYELNKRSVTNLNCAGPFIKTVMTRCIHCTRCVRFVNEISSVFDFGVIGRGAAMEIGTYIQNFINDELLGNIIDLCPVGALISMPSSFIGRSWELTYIQSVDILDSISSGIKIAVSNNNVIRIVPSLDEFYDEWITNKARFVYDSFNNQRLYYPKLKLHLKFIILSWKYALILFLHLLYNKCKNNIDIYCGPFISLDLALTLKSFLNSLGCSNIYYFENNINNIDFRYSYILNITLKNFYKINSLLLIAINPRLEIPLLNSYLRKNYLNNFNFKVYSIGYALDYLTYPVINLGSSIKNLYKFLMGLNLISNYFLINDYYNHYYFNIKNSLSFYLFIGSSNILRSDKDSLLNSLFIFFTQFKLPINNINIVNRHLGRISLNEVGFSTGVKVRSKLLSINNSLNFLLGLDQFKQLEKKKGILNVYQGFFYISNFFDKINLILPTSIYVEHSSFFINLEGRLRITNKAITPFKFIFFDTNVIESFSILIVSLYKDNFSIINNFKKINKIFYNLVNFYSNYLCNIRSYIILYENNIINLNKKIYDLSFANYLLNNTIFNKIIYNYYSSDIFSKKSKVLTISSYKVKFLTFNDKIILES